jgi:lactate dehydrogenase-like 2-hydroxyacid dehydrogenase
MPHVLTEGTAELGFALVMAVARRIPDADRFTLDAFRRMKKDAIFVNIGRGPIGKEDDLVTALTEGELFGAGIDVYEFEPEITTELLSLDNVTPANTVV